MFAIGFAFPAGKQPVSESLPLSTHTTGVMQGFLCRTIHRASLPRLDDRDFISSYKIARPSIMIAFKVYAIAAGCGI